MKLYQHYLSLESIVFELKLGRSHPLIKNSNTTLITIIDKFSLDYLKNKLKSYVNIKLKLS